MTTVKLDEYNNNWFDPGRSLITRIIWYFVNIFFFINPCNPSSELKIWILRLFGANIGNNILMKPSINIKYPWRLTIGNNVWIGEHVWIDNLAHVRLGNNVCLSQGAMILTGNHNYKTHTFDLIVDEVNIEEGVWIGAQAIVCPGIKCSSHSILLTASVATKDLQPFEIYQGNPCRFVRKREIIE